MALLNPFGRLGSPFLTGAGVTLRHPHGSDYDAWAKLRNDSRDHLQPWEPTWGPDELTKSAYRRRLSRYAQEIREDRGYPFWIFMPGGDLIGGCTLSNIRRGVSQSASMGYWTGFSFAGKGLMTAAVGAVLSHSFGSLSLHRIEAACLPNNTASRRVLAKNGFKEEGFAERYLKINGDWRDHVLFGIVEENWRKIQSG